MLPEAKCDNGKYYPSTLKIRPNSTKITMLTQKYVVLAERTMFWGLDTIFTKNKIQKKILGPPSGEEEEEGNQRLTIDGVRPQSWGLRFLTTIIFWDQGFFKKSLFKKCTSTSFRDNYFGKNKHLLRTGLRGKYLRGKSKLLRGLKDFVYLWSIWVQFWRVLQHFGTKLSKKVNLA